MIATRMTSVLFWSAEPWFRFAVRHLGAVLRYRDRRGRDFTDSQERRELAPDEPRHYRSARDDVEGDLFFIRGRGTIEIPGGKKVCIYALNSLFPFLTSKQREDELPHDDWVSETETLCCPDPKGVVFKITPLP